MRNGIALTPAAAARFGHKLELCRSVTRLSLRSVSEVARVSAQYLNNIEKGTRLSPSPEVLNRMSAAYMLPAHTMDDLLFEARVMSALEQLGVPEPTRTDLYRGCEQKLAEAGHPVVTDIGEIIRVMLSR